MNTHIRLLLLLFTHLTCIPIAKSQQYELKQVLILSRHNIRTPLAKTLTRMTPKQWPHWKEKSGFLTAKGAVLEGYMGEYFYAWLYKERLLPKSCPTQDIFYVYANTKQRTKASAQAFVDKAYPDCNITVHCSADKTDPIFNPVIHNSSSIFKELAAEEMRATLNSLHLNDSYKFLANILDYRDSDMCIRDKKCDLITDKNRIVNVLAGDKPNVSGPIKIGNSVIDAFKMEYYEGFNTKDVAWGLLADSDKWQTVTDLTVGYHNVIFNTTLVAKDISKPLVKYVSDIFIKGHDKPKVTLLMGHDANMYTVMNSMGFKAWDLHNQYDKTPVGGKVVFQKWLQKKHNTYLLKIDYVYQSAIDMRNGSRISMKYPPEFKSLELVDCKVDDAGFCRWEDFIKLLKNL